MMSHFPFIHRCRQPVPVILVEDGYQAWLAAEDATAIRESNCMFEAQAMTREEILSECLPSSLLQWQQWGPRTSIFGAEPLGLITTAAASVSSFPPPSISCSCPHSCAIHRCVLFNSRLSNKIWLGAERLGIQSICQLY